jgi:predicted phosphoadenosine phosphosulfate sulfurtransferase
MKIYLNRSVWDAALARMHFLFDEFPNVIVNVSGGKDSTVIFNLAMMVAEEKGLLPLKVMYLDQEAEWTSVIEHIREIMSDPRVEPYWLQVPFKMSNSTSNREEFLNAWAPGEEWLREKEPDSITENVYRVDRFHDMFPAFLAHHYKGEPACYLVGVRAEESPGRLLGLTGGLTYKDITWGKRLGPGHFNFYPLYDWSYTDIWKSIHDNHWSYCRLYDQQYQYGLPVSQMRVSNLHHETSLKSLHYLQEIEADLWNKLVKRLPGINTCGQMKDEFNSVSGLPPMFRDWKEYRDYLLKHLIREEHQDKMASMFRAQEDAYIEAAHDRMFRVHVNAILTNDYEGVKLNNFASMMVTYTKSRVARDMSRDKENANKRIDP